MIIKDVSFIKSAALPTQYPDHDFPEIAFAGRSNVGKSSLINCLFQRKNMVKTSSKPGCTRLINFFTLNQELCFVDLPGYGYAKVSKSMRKELLSMIDQYLWTRKNLLGLVLLIDIRREPDEHEFEMVDYLLDNNIPHLIVLTKADKLSKSKQNQTHLSVCSMFERDKDGVILFSAKTKNGRNIILNQIENLIKDQDEIR